MAERPRTSSSASKSKFAILTSTSNPPLPPKANRPVVRPTANTGAKVRQGPQARDARVERDSIGDFAEFIRSTGPPGASFDDIVPPRSSPAVNGYRSQNGSVRNGSISSPRVGALSATPRRSESSATRRRLQAREAVIANADSSALIDFIRQGPPTEKNHDNPRIPRTVAPFRTTMDSDQMSGAVGGRVNELANQEPRRSQASTSFSTDHSARSVNSQSALLNTYNPKKPPPTNVNTFDEADRMPQRKTRRVKDPYAIDDSDDEDALDTPLAKPVKQEESLAEFLKNVTPPPVPTSSVFESVPKPPIKKSSTPSLMSRFARKESFSNAVPTRANNNAPQVASHIPISITTKQSASSSQLSSVSARQLVSSSNSSYASRMDTERKPSRVAHNTYQSRGVDGRSRSITRTPTNDLADFLKNTPPPPTNGPQRLSIGIGPVKEEGSFAKMFGRRKKAAVA